MSSSKHFWLDNNSHLHRVLVSTVCSALIYDRYSITQHSQLSYRSQKACKGWQGSRIRGQPLRPPGRRRRMGCCCAMTRARPPRVQRSGWGQGEPSTPERAPSRTPPPPDAPRSYTWRRGREREDQSETMYLLSCLSQQCCSQVFARLP